LARVDKATGEPRKMSFGPWMMKAFGVLGRMKHLRGGTFDVFGYTAERKLERQMISDYESIVSELESRLSPQTHKLALQIAALPLDIKGFGHVKLKNYKTVKDREAQMLAELRNPTPAPQLKAAE
jgi:indolepyruvate ferredoxin oxidoreductase